MLARGCVVPLLLAAAMTVACHSVNEAVARGIATMATNATENFVRTYCTCNTSASALHELLFPAFFRGTVKSLQASASQLLLPDAAGPEVPLHVQLDLIASAPLITDTLAALNAPYRNPLLLATPTPPFSAPSQIAFSRPTLSADGRWTDFPGGTFNDLSVILDPRNIRVQHYMLYRRDVLLAANVTTPPQTWEQLLEVAALIHGRDMDGDGLPDTALCFDAEATCGLPYLLLKILLPMMLHPRSGPKAFILDPATMLPLANTAAMAAALTTYARLAPFNIRTAGSCRSLHPAFLAGECAITFTFYQELPIISHLRGRLGTALPPGTTHVWDPPTNSLVPCTRVLCPFAVPPRPPLPNQPPNTLVNFAPFNIPLYYSFSPHPNIFLDPSATLASFAAQYTVSLNTFLLPFYSAVGPLLPVPSSSSAGTPSRSPSPQQPPYNNRSAHSPAATPVPTRATLAAMLAHVAASRPEIAPPAPAADINPSAYLQRGAALEDAVEFLYTASQILAFNNCYDGLNIPGASYFRCVCRRVAFHYCYNSLNIPGASYFRCVCRCAALHYCYNGLNIPGAPYFRCVCRCAAFHYCYNALNIPRASYFRCMCRCAAFHYCYNGINIPGASYFRCMCRCAAFHYCYIGLNIPGASYFRLAMGEAAKHASRPRANLTRILETMDFKYRMVLEAFNNTDLYRQLYWSGIGYQPTSSAPTASSSPLWARHAPNSQFWSHSSFAGVVVACALLVLLLAGLLFAWRHTSAGRLSILGKRLAPGLGHATTLLVTDIQNSTGLWELLPAELMEQALAVHHTTLQQLLDTYHGYESATEGDSFILAFHSPHDALAYAAAAQLALLHADWPPELLEVEALAPVAAMRRAAPPPSCQSAVIQSLLSSTPAMPPIQRPTSFRATSPSTNPAPAGTPIRAILRNFLTGLLTTCSMPSKLRHCLPACARAFQQPQLHQQQQQYAPGASRHSRHSVDSIGQDSMAADLEQIAQGGPETVPSCSFSWALSEAWSLQPLPASGPSMKPPAGPSPASQALNPIWRGLRVRMGLHSGLSDPHLLSTNRTTGRTQYSGSFLAAAQQVCDAGHGGQILLSRSTFERFNQTPHRGRAAGPTPLILAMGEHVLQEGSPPVGLYQAVVPGLQARLQSLLPARALRAETGGVLVAPVGAATVVFARVSDLPLLLSWNAQLTQAAVGVLHDAARSRVLRYGGYIAELVDGLVLAVFQRPVDAINWALHVQQALLMADWPAELLQHALCEPVVATVAVAMSGASVTMEKLALRGLRLKVGIATGEVLDYISPATARIMYRGRVMNWAARISALATSGQVLCTETTWRLARRAPPAELQGLAVSPVGEHVLRGITGSVGLHCCSLISRVPAQGPHQAPGTTPVSH